MAIEKDHSEIVKLLLECEKLDVNYKKILYYEFLFREDWINYQLNIEMKTFK
mgnify:CR=1 FL=1